MSQSHLEKHLYRFLNAMKCTGDGWRFNVRDVLGIMFAACLTARCAALFYSNTRHPLSILTGILVSLPLWSLFLIIRRRTTAGIGLLILWLLLIGIGCLLTEILSIVLF